MHGPCQAKVKNTPEAVELAHKPGLDHGIDPGVEPSVERCLIAPDPEANRGAVPQRPGRRLLEHELGVPDPLRGVINPSPRKINDGIGHG